MIIGISVNTTTAPAATVCVALTEPGRGNWKRTSRPRAEPKTARLAASAAPVVSPAVRKTWRLAAGLGLGLLVVGVVWVVVVIISPLVDVFNYLPDG